MKKPEGISDEQFTALTRDKIIARLMEMDSWPNLLRVNAAIDCIERENGSATPVETFIAAGCLQGYLINKADPNHLGSYWDCFERDFAEAIREHHRFGKLYAEILEESKQTGGAK